MSDLRQRKFARTRLGLAHVLADALGSQRFDEIPVKHLCRAAEVSDATFFNYFPRKQDLLAYLGHLWVLELGWHVQAAAQSGRGIPVIEVLFAQVARTCERRPGVLAELLAWIARGGNLSDTLQISAIEKRLAFPDLDGIDQMPVKGVDAWLLPQIEAAMSQGELPDNVLVPLVMSSLLSVLFGVPLTLLATDPARIAAQYRQQLAIVFAGVRATATGAR